jgi:uncharacterized protein YxeA
MNQKTKQVLIGVLLLIVGAGIGLLIAETRERGENLEEYVEAREESPNPEKFDQDFENMVTWLENYKRENPGATDEDASRAFEEAWAQ